MFTITAVIRKEFHEYRMITCKLAKMPRLISSYRLLGKPKQVLYVDHASTTES